MVLTSELALMDCVKIACQVVCIIDRSPFSARDSTADIEVTARSLESSVALVGQSWGCATAQPSHSHPKGVGLAALIFMSRRLRRWFVQSGLFRLLQIRGPMPTEYQLYAVPQQVSIHHQ